MICDKPLITDGKLNGEYTEVEVQWSNGSKMRIAVCKKCATDGTWATDSGKDTITDWHHVYWERSGVAVDREIVIV